MPTHLIRAACLGLSLAALAACSSSFGGGGTSPGATIVVPPGSDAVCSNGTRPPC